MPSWSSSSFLFWWLTPIISFQPMAWLNFITRKRWQTSITNLNQPANPHKILSDSPQSSRSDVVSELKVPQVSTQQLLIDLEQLKQENATLHAQLEQHEGHVLQLHQKYEDAISRERSHAAAEYKRYHQQLREKDDRIAILVKREEDLRGAHEFLTSEDRCSGVDVKVLLEALNYDILQVATAIAQCLANQVFGVVDNEMPVDKPYPHGAEWITDILGERFCRALAATDHKEDYTLLQFGLQAALCFSCYHLIHAWDSGAFGDLSIHLTNIYATMQTEEPQSVFARWRALTQRNLNRVITKEYPHSLNEILLKPILDVVLVASARIRRDVRQETLVSLLNEKLRMLQPHISKIKNAIALDFISADLGLVYIYPGHTFDKARMRDAFEHGQTDNQEPQVNVVSTSELGLELRKKVEGPSFVESRILLRPQVFLEPAFIELTQLPIEAPTAESEPHF